VRLVEEDVRIDLSALSELLYQWTSLAGLLFDVVLPLLEPNQWLRRDLIPQDLEDPWN
jgi:hypothetical protein